MSLGFIYTELFLTWSDVDEKIQTEHILISDVSSGESITCWYHSNSNQLQGTLKWYHQFIGRTRPGDEIPMNNQGWKWDIRTVGIRDRQLILRKEVDTGAIEGVFTCRVQGASLQVVNRVNPVSVWIHYPSKSLLSDTPLLLADETSYSFVDLSKLAMH